MPHQTDFYAGRLRHLADAFRAGYPSCPPFRCAVITGAACGATFLEQDWDLLLAGEGHPWKWYAIVDPDEQGARWPTWRCCWFTDRKNVELSGAYKTFLGLASETARARCGLLREGRCDPDHTSFPAELWVPALFGLAWHADSPVFKAARYRFHIMPDAPDTLVRVDYSEEMDADAELTSPAWQIDGLVMRPAVRCVGARLGFQHRFCSILAPDVFQASALAIEALLSKDFFGEATKPPTAHRPPTPDARPHAEAGDGETKRPAKKATINAQMIDALQSHREAIGWTAKQWSQHLKCSPAAVVGTHTWKSMKLDREEGRAERTKDRRRRKRHFGNSD